MTASKATPVKIVLIQVPTKDATSMESSKPIESVSSNFPEPGMFFRRLATKT